MCLTLSGLSHCLPMIRFKLNIFGENMSQMLLCFFSCWSQQTLSEGPDKLFQALRVTWPLSPLHHSCSKKATGDHTWMLECGCGPVKLYGHWVLILFNPLFLFPGWMWVNQVWWWWQKEERSVYKLLNKSEFSKILFMKVSESQTNSKQQSNAICI